MKIYSRGTTEIIIGLVLTIASSITSSHAKDRSIGKSIYRAYEPASVQLDINLQQDTLSLFLSIPPEAASTITKQPLHFLAQHLNEFTPLALLPEDAECKQTQKQFLAESIETPVLKSESLTAHSDTKQITGYLEYECQNPDNLSHLTFRGFKAMPGLKHTSVWIISDNWQNKQQLGQEQKRIQLKKKQDMTDFFLDFFND